MTKPQLTLQFLREHLFAADQFNGREYSIEGIKPLTKAQCEEIIRLAAVGLECEEATLVTE